MRRAKRKPGRPSKLTAERTKAICRGLRELLYFHEACSRAGVDKSTAHRWLARGATEKRGQYRDFYDAIQRAEADAEHAALANIRKAARGGTWVAAAWLLERRYPGRWARRTIMQPEDDQRIVDRFAALAKMIGGDKLQEQMFAAAIAALDPKAQEAVRRDELEPEPTPPAPASPPPLRAIAGGAAQEATTTTATQE